MKRRKESFLSSFEKLKQGRGGRAGGWSYGSALRACTARVEGSTSVPLMTASHSRPVTPVPRVLAPSSGLLRHRFKCTNPHSDVYIYTDFKNKIRRVPSGFSWLLSTVECSQRKVRAKRRACQWAAWLPAYCVGWVTSRACSSVGLSSIAFPWLSVLHFLVGFLSAADIQETSR